MPDESASHTPVERTPGVSRKNKGKRKEMTRDWRTFDPSTMDTGGDDTLIEELITYKKNLDRLISKHEGDYVLIKGDEVIDCFPTQADALEAGAERFGAEPALIKRIVLKEKVYSPGGLAD